MSDNIRNQPPTSLPDAPPTAPVQAEANLPSPTPWPAIAASGITLMLWGLITSYVVTGAGAVLFIVAAAGWAQQILAEEPEHGGEEG